MAVTTTVTTAIPIRMNRLNHLLNVLSFTLAISIYPFVISSYPFVISSLSRNLYSFR